MVTLRILVEKIKPLKADFVSTGHYAKVEFDKNYHRYLLKRAKDSKKDQTYFLYNTSQEVLSKTLFPLADLEKEEVRQIAKDENILTYSKKDSEEICFVQNRDHGFFIKQRNPELIKEGYFIDENGNKLGKHNGIVYYTIGQRKGLGIALGKRVFVSKINAKDNTVTLSDENTLYKDKIKIRDGGAYAETSGGFFTSLRKRLAFTTASSRLVTVAAPLNFFGRPPSELGAARHFFAPT